MTQERIINFLKNNKDYWFSAKYISEELKVNISSISKALHSLRKYKLVDYRIEDIKGRTNIVHVLVYKYKKENNVKVKHGKVY